MDLRGHEEDGAGSLVNLAAIETKELIGPGSKENKVVPFITQPLDVLGPSCAFKDLQILTLAKGQLRDSSSFPFLYVARPTGIMKVYVQLTQIDTEANKSKMVKTLYFDNYVLQPAQKHTKLSFEDIVPPKYIAKAKEEHSRLVS